MNKRILKSLIRENQLLDAGLLTPARVTEIVRDAKGNAIRIEHDPEEYRREQAAKSASRVCAARRKLDLSQDGLSALLGVSRRTVENWEQGRRVPGGAARLLLTVAERHPDVVLEAMA